MHTLLLVDRLMDNQQFSDKASPQALYFQPPQGGAPYAATGVPFDVTYQEKFQIYGAELSQIFEWPGVTLLGGVRYQSGEFRTQDQYQNPGGAFAPFFTSASYGADTTDQFRRLSAYSYLTVEPLPHLRITGGLAADQETFPYYFRNPPVAPGEDTRFQLGPKAAVVWSPVPQATLRSIYSRSLGGVSIDESYRLEPTQLAGFPQAFRSLISESIVGSQSAPTFETLGAAIDLKLGSRTYLGLRVERLGSEVNEGVGNFLAPNGGLVPMASSASQQLHYVEQQAAANLNQMLGGGVVLGAGYAFTKSSLKQTFPDIPISDQALASTLQDLHTYLLFDHPSGFYAKVEANWYGQDNAGWTPAEPDSRFFQENIFAGWRFAHRRAQAEIGILNLSGGGYNLNPLTVYQELPRKRVFEMRFKFVF